MLYVTTRNDRDVFTANWALRENRCALGGHYLPFRHPRISAEEMERLLTGSSGDCIAYVLNLAFGTKITGWDVELTIGRRCVRLDQIQYGILLAECWHTPGYRFERIECALTRLVTGDSQPVSGWMRIAVRIGVLFGILSDLRKIGVSDADISCMSGDFITPVSCWYARHWGLPIRNIICCCNENNALWELLVNGQMRTDGVCIPTGLPEADITVPEHLERLIREHGGAEEALRYLDAVRKGRSYCPSDLMLNRLREGMYVSVVGSRRIRETIPAVYKTHGRLLSRATALAYAGALDHRAKNGSAGFAVIWSEESPGTEADGISEILDIPSKTINEYL